MGAEVLIPLAIAAVSTGAQVYNTRRTANKQDAALAGSIRNQASKQRQIDARTNAEVAKLEQSRSADEAAASRAAYGEQLRRNRAAMEGGLTPNVGSAAFKEDAAQGVKEVGGYADETAGLMSRMDAPTMQRQGEGFGFQQLATDNMITGREAQGQAFMDDLRLRAIRRNPWIDAASQIGMAYAGTMGGGMGASGAGTGASLNQNAAANAGMRVGSAGGMYNGYYNPPRWGG
jgi:hypothetical protein